MLPDGHVLLEIFEFYVDEDFEQQPEWITLAHMCRRWRSVVFQISIPTSSQSATPLYTQNKDILQELVEGRTTEVLPTLETIFLEGFQLRNHSTREAYKNSLPPHGGPTRATTL